MLNIFSGEQCGQDYFTLIIVLCTDENKAIIESQPVFSACFAWIGGANGRDLLGESIPLLACSDE